MSKIKTSKKKKKSKTSSYPNYWVLVAIIPCFILLFPNFNSEFVNWDDDKNIYDNEHVKNFDIQKIFSSHVIGNYNPLTTLSFAIEAKLYGKEIMNQKKAFNFQITNLLLHLICIFLVFLICKQMNMKDLAILVVCSLFALHPMRVESVSWVTERKDVLYGVFFLSSLLYYCKFLNNRKNRKFLWLAFFLFIPALLSKIQAVTLPVSMLFLDYYWKRKITIKLISEKALFFIASLITGLLGIYFLGLQDSLNQGAHFQFVERIAIGGYSLIVYLVKWIVPYEMVPLYPYPAKLSWIFWCCVPLALIFVAGFFFAFKKKNRILVCGLGFFLANIVLLLQILGAGQGFIADRFTYIAYLGLFWIQGHYLALLAERSDIWKKISYTLLAVVIVIYSLMSFTQKKIWHNSETLWTHVLNHYDKTPTPFGNRENHYRDHGNSEAALKDYSEAIRLAPNNDRFFNSRGKLYFDKRANEAAITDFTKAINLNQSKANYYANRGAAYAQSGNLQGALSDLNTCLTLNPNYTTGLLNRSVIYRQLGKWQENLNDLNTYLKINPNNPSMWIEAARANTMLSRYQDALQNVQMALRLNPTNGNYHYDLAKIYLKMANYNAARLSANKAKSMGAKVPTAFFNELK